MKTDQVSAYFWGLLRIVMGWTFLWPFLDKLLGLGFSTCATETGTIEFMCDSAWISGGSPTFGFLTHGTKGPFAEIFQALAGNPVVDALFMLGLLGVGISLLLGVAVKFGGWSGAIIMLLMFFAGSLLPENNPLIDDHIVYALLLVAFTYTNAGETLGLGKWWATTSLYQKFKFLR